MKISGVVPRWVKRTVSSLIATNSNHMKYSDYLVNMFDLQGRSSCGCFKLLVTFCSISNRREEEHDKAR